MDIKGTHLWRVVLQSFRDDHLLITTDKRDPLLALNKVLDILKDKTSDFYGTTTFKSLEYGGTLDA